MIRVLLVVRPGEAKALRAMARRFRFEDALRFLHRNPDIAPEALMEAIKKLRAAIDAVPNVPR